MKLFEKLIIGLLFGMVLVGIAFSFLVGKLNTKVSEINNVQAVQTFEYSEWECRRIVYCPWEDWRYAKPSDVCTYEKVKEFTPIKMKPVTDMDGEYCLPVEKK